MTNPLHIILLGAPGAGKGTQGQRLAEVLSIPKLATGDMLRAETAANTSLGVKAKSFMDKGELVPDTVVIDMIAERITKGDCANGFILDGFPRTVAQAEVLDKMMKSLHIALDFVFCLDVEEEEIVQRQSGRLMAPTSGRVYHSVTNPPKVPGVCDVSGEPLISRADDAPDVVRHRLRVFAEQTAPVKAFYAAQHKLIEVDGMQPINTVFDTLMGHVRKKQVA